MLQELCGGKMMGEAKNKSQFNALLDRKLNEPQTKVIELIQPNDMPDNVYKVLSDCLHVSPEKRPALDQILVALSNPDEEESE